MAPNNLDTNESPAVMAPIDDEVVVIGVKPAVAQTNRMALSSAEVAQTLGTVPNVNYLPMALVAKAEVNPKKRSVSSVEVVQVLKYNPADGPIALANAKAHKEDLAPPVKKRARLHSSALAPIEEEKELELVEVVTKKMRRFDISYPDLSVLTM